MPAWADMREWLTTHGFTRAQARFAVVHLYFLCTASIGSLHRQLKYFDRATADRPEQDIFRVYAGPPLNRRDDIEKSCRAQWDIAVTFFLDALEAAAPDWPSWTAPTVHDKKNQGPR